MKRFIKMVFSCLMAVVSLSGCTQTEEPKINPNQKLSIVCTTFPAYDWTRQILGNQIGDVELTFLMSGNTDLHSFQPTVDDIIRISTCDLFIYVGGESDAWIVDVLAGAVNQDMQTVNLLEVLGETAKLEEVIEGMEREEAQDDEEEYDEHVWLSLPNAKLFCSVIADALSSVDEAHAKEYQDNLLLYTEQLSKLDEEYRIAINEAPVKFLLFGDRFPFRYLVDDYGLDYFAAFPGCSAETEASFETIIYLADKTDELSLGTIMVTETSDQSIAKTIIRNTKDKNQNILVLDSMQSVNETSIKNGTNYLSIMENNLNVLKQAVR